MMRIRLVPVDPWCRRTWKGWSQLIKAKPNEEYRDVDGEGVGNSVDHFEITSPSDIPIATPTSSDRMNAYSSWMSRKEKFTMDKSQLDLYLEEKNVDHKSKFDVLAWWKNNGAPRHPQLAALARDILAIHLSSRFCF
ncbi:Zinc finger BED domain-containing protein RICESLEEPER 1 [Bienertia sinuspersici]